jgi:hypothetical protein
MKTSLLMTLLILRLFRSEAQRLANNDAIKVNFPVVTYAIARFTPVPSFRTGETAFITCNIPEQHNGVTILIMSMEGKIFYEELIEERGDVYITIYGKTLPQGEYSCLMVSGVNTLASTPIKVLGR